MHSSPAKFTLPLCLLVACSGCSSLQKEKQGQDSGWSITKLWKKEYQTPNSLAVIWSPDILTVPGKPPTRGFGGRVFFYNERSQAIPVDGDIVVHGYHGEFDKMPESKLQADKTFAFTAEQLTGHFSPSQLGASYSIWIPWDVAEGYQAPITLVPTFRAKDGRLVQGAAAKLVLPGKSLESGSSENKLPVQTISYQASSTPTNPGVELPQLGSAPVRRSSGMRTTTIEVPNGATLARSSQVADSARLTLELGQQHPGAGSETAAPPVNSSGSSGITVGGGQRPRPMPNAANGQWTHPTYSNPGGSLPATGSQPTDLPAIPQGQGSWQPLPATSAPAGQTFSGGDAPRVRELPKLATTVRNSTPPTTNPFAYKPLPTRSVE